jgi:hypothetical protein
MDMYVALLKGKSVHWVSIETADVVQFCTQSSIEKINGKLNQCL